MKSYDIYDESRPNTLLGSFEGDHPIDALAAYAVKRGYADPREAEEGAECFDFTNFDGFTRMTFENSELIAVPVDAPADDRGEFVKGALDARRGGAPCRP